MSYFTTPLKVTAVSGGWRLDEPLMYYSTTLNRLVQVPAAFETDLASVPKLLRWLVPVANAKNRRAAVVHDYLCSTPIQAVYGIDQRTADRVWREALAVCNVNTLGQWGLWLPVRTYQFFKGLL